MKSVYWKLCVAVAFRVWFRNLASKYQQDGVGLGPLHELVVFKFKSTLKELKKDLYHSCRKEVVSA